MITREDLIVNTKLLYKSTMRVMAKNTVQKKPRDTNYFMPSLKYPSPFFMNFSSVVMNSSKHFKRTQCKINDEIQCAG